MKVVINMACPVCIDQGYQSSYEVWKHTGCGGTLRLDENAMCSCDGCSRTAHITQMRYECNNNIHTFKIASINGYAQAIATASHMVNAKTNQWFRNMLINLG